MNEIQIKNENGQLYVSSRDVATGLNKNHKDVITKIKEVLCEREFSLTCQKVKMPNGGYREEPEYLLTKDGFILLCMNYTGYNDFKRAYIRRFNEMEAQLKQPLALPLNDLLFFHFKSTLFLVKPVDSLCEGHLIVSYQGSTIVGTVQIGYPNPRMATIRTDGQESTAYCLLLKELKAIGKIVWRVVKIHENLSSLKKLPGYIHGITQEPVSFPLLNAENYHYDDGEVRSILRELLRTKEEIIKLRQKEVKQLKKEIAV